MILVTDDESTFVLDRADNLTTRTCCDGVPSFGPGQVDAGARSVRVAEALQALNDRLAFLCLPILEIEIRGRDADQDEGQPCSSDAGIEARSSKGVSIGRHFCRRSEKQNSPVVWGILASKGQGTDDTANASPDNDDGGAKGAPPDAADVVRLICQRQGDVGVGPGDDQDGAKVSDSVLRGVSQDNDPDDLDDTVEEKEGCSKPPPIGKQTLAKADDGADHVALTHGLVSGHIHVPVPQGSAASTHRSAHALSSRLGEAQALTEDDGQEVCGGIRDGRGQTKASRHQDSSLRSRKAWSPSDRATESFGISRAAHSHEEALTWPRNTFLGECGMDLARCPL